MEEYLKFAKEIALYAGKEMKEYFYKDKNVEYKEDRTPVTIADKQINDYLIKKVNEVYPTHSVIGEEASDRKNSKYSWVCDPVDGTSSFTRGIPVSVFSLALVEDGIPIVGVVYDPFLDEMYSAVIGKGAYMNDKQIHVNDLSYGVLGSSIDYCMWDKAKFDTLDIVKELRTNNKTCSMGSVAHACMLVARGSVSAQIFPGTSHGNCDIAASKLIVEEAGGKTSDFFGDEQRYDKDINGFIASNGIIHDDITKLTRKIYKK